MGKKSWAEIILMPLVVAIVGIVGTYLITKQSGEDATLLGKAQLLSTKEQADADRQVKILGLSDIPKALSG